MTAVRLLVDSIFVFSVIFIWLMLLYQFVLCIGGFFLWRKERKKPESTIPDTELPDVSILIPARNEEKVIGSLLERIGELDYPEEKLEILVIDDGSDDTTGEIVNICMRKNPRIRLISIPVGEGGKGKGEALNRGLNESSHEVLAVYDADNMPEKESLKFLCRALVANPKLAAVTGKYRAYNKSANLLTKFINIESIAFQWIIQAGRWMFLKIAFISGTNFVIRKSVLKELGGWQPDALTEDTDLTFRIYQKGYLVRFLPQSVSWEQEPERLKTWIRQRVRWARGNSYIISHYTRRVFKTKIKATTFELLNLFFLYYFFIFAILFSDILFILSLLKVVRIRVLGPYFELWILAFFLFVLELLIALSLEREDSFGSLLIIVLAYLTYTKLWIFVVLKSFFQEFFQKRERLWDKTERVDIREHTKEAAPGKGTGVLRK
jgi:cellulose synthase/poly-beta-1,6-N-acetylglucosamine synthase-like glycosyltransferase